MFFAERLSIVDYTGEVSATTGTGHLPGQDTVFVLVNVRLYATLYHGRKHRYLRLEAVAIRLCEGIQIPADDGRPAAVCGSGQCLHLRLGDVLAFHHAAAGPPRLHGNHHQMTLQPREDGLILAGLYLLRPEAVVVVVAAQPRHTDANGILRPADNPVAPLRIVLEAEHQLRQRLGVHVGEAVGPYLANHVARAGGEAATLANLEGGLQTDGQRPAGGVLRNIGLVNPRPRQVQSRRDLALGLLEVGAAAGGEALVRVSVQFYVLNAPLLAAATLLLAAAVAVHHKHVGLHDVQRGHEVHHPAPRVDIRILHIADALHHEQALLFAVDGLAVLVAQVRLVAPDTYVQVAILRRLPEKLHMTAMQQVVTTADENFFRHINLPCVREDRACALSSYRAPP